VYAGDAVAMQLPLLGGDATGHDWHNLLVQTGLLSQTTLIANSIYILGLLVIVLSIGLGLWNGLANPKADRIG
jgi:hypothetical protein